MKLVCEFTDGDIDPYDYMFEFSDSPLRTKKMSCKWCIKKTYCRFGNPNVLSRTDITLCELWRIDYI